MDWSRWTGFPPRRNGNRSPVEHGEDVEEPPRRGGGYKFESDVLNLTLVKPTNATSIDSTKLKKKYPDIASECSKTTAKAGYVKITLKEGGQ